MSIPFPVGKSAVFSLAEFVARLLGLFFLARFMSAFGLDAGGMFRTSLPLIILAGSVGAVGLPTALTRWLAADGLPKRLRASQVWTILIATLCAMLLALFCLDVILHLTFIPILGIGPVDGLLRFSVPFIFLLGIGGSLRGVMIGRGRNLPPALAQGSASLAQVGFINSYTVQFLKHIGWTGGEAGIAIITAAEAVGVLVLSIYSIVDIVRIRADSSPIGKTERDPSLWHELRTIFRLTASPTLQTVLETLGYGLELPMAEHLLTLQFGQATAEQWMAEYAAVAIPLLHFPLFAADGLATALLPTLTAGRVAQGRKALGPSLVQIIRAMFVLAIPSSLLLFVFAPTFTAWLDAPEATNLLRVMAPLAIFVYAQSPLSSILQAQGRSRALLYAGLLADVARISTLFISMTVWHLGVWGLVAAFAVGVTAETGVLYISTWRMTPVSLPWTSFGYATLTGIQMCAILLVGEHQPGPYAFSADPVIWFILAILVAASFLIISRELPPAALKPIPFLGRRLERIAKVMAGIGSA